jgi:hypothetical protein
MKTFSNFAFLLACVFAAGCTSQKVTSAENDNQRQGALIQEGKQQWADGKLDEAEITFNRVLAVNTNNEMAAYYLSLVHREQIDHRRPAIFSYHRTVVTNYQKMPIERRTMESFGQFDSSTTVEDVINRVGPPDLRVSISGIQYVSYFLPPPFTNGIDIQSPGGSFISSVTYGKTILYARGTNDW